MVEVREEPPFCSKRNNVCLFPENEWERFEQDRCCGQKQSGKSHVGGNRPGAWAALPSTAIYSQPPAVVASARDGEGWWLCTGEGPRRTPRSVWVKELAVESSSSGRGSHEFKHSSTHAHIHTWSAGRLTFPLLSPSHTHTTHPTVCTHAQLHICTRKYSITVYY